MKYRLTSITETGSTIQSGWSFDGNHMETIYKDFKKRYPLWVHILETK